MSAVYLTLRSMKGTARVREDMIGAISPPVSLKGNPESRVLSIVGDRVYILNTAANCAALGIPFERMPQPEDDTPIAPPKRGRKKKTAKTEEPTP